MSPWSMIHFRISLMGYAKSEWFLVCVTLNLLFFEKVADEFDRKFEVERFLLFGI